MKKLSLLILLVILLISCSSQKTADDVINDYIKTIGGKEALDSIQTIYLKRELVYEEANETRVNTSYQKRPNMRRFGALDASRFIATDGKTVWQVQVDSTSKKSNWTEMPEDRAKALLRNSDFFRFLGPFIDYQKYNMTVEYIGNETNADLQLDRIKLTWSDGTSWEYFFNTETKLIHQFKPAESTTVLVHDYRMVGDVLVPFETIGTGTTPQGKFRHINQTTEIKFNIPLADSLFMPVKE